MTLFRPWYDRVLRWSRHPHAERYLGAITYRFNRRFDLHALPNRLLVAALATGPRPERWIRVAETHC